MLLKRILVIWLVVSLAVLRVTGAHAHAHESGGSLEMHVFDAGVHAEHHAGHDASAKPGPHLESHAGERDIELPGKIGKLPGADTDLAVLILALALLPWLARARAVTTSAPRRAPRPPRPPYFTPPTQGPPLSA